MKITDFKKRTRDSDWGSYEEFQCPFCGEWHYSDSVRIHISKKATWEVKKKLPSKPHHEFYLENTVEIKVRKWK